MKKILAFALSAMAILATASCQKDTLNTVNAGDSAQVTLSLGVNGGIATKAADAAADVLAYSVYTAEGELVGDLVTVENAFKGGSESVALTLVKGKEYTVAFWAQNSACDAYTVAAGAEGMTVEVNYAGQNNDMTRDAYFGNAFTVEDNTTIEVVLRRPFAKVNFGVSAEDWNAAQAAGLNVTESKAVLNNVATTLNVNYGTVAGETTVAYDYAALPTVATKAAAEAQDFVVNGQTYKLLSSSYILADEVKTLLNDGAEFGLNTTEGELVINEGLNNLPVQRNFSTNVLASKALTGTSIITVTTEQEQYGSEEIPAGDVAAFKAALADANVGEIVLPYGVYEGLFVHTKGVKVIKSADPANKAIIKGKIGVSATVEFENIVFQVSETYSAMNTGHQYLDRFQRNSIVPIYAAKAKFTGCEFYDIYNSHQTVAINYGAHRVNTVLEIDNCYFQGYAYAFYSRALLKVTNSTFDLYHNTYNPRTIFLYGLGDGNQGSVVFQNNTFTGKGLKAYCMEMSSANYDYKNICYDVQKNNGFGVENKEGVKEYFLPRVGDGVCDFTGTTFADNSEEFKF